MPLPYVRIAQTANLLAAVNPVPAVRSVLNDMAFFAFELHVLSKLRSAYRLNLELAIDLAICVFGTAQHQHNIIAAQYIKGCLD